MSTGSIEVQEIGQAPPADEREAILNGLNLLYSTRAGELSMDRDFGIDWSAVDMPAEASKAMLSAEVIGKTEKYEPRVAVSSISWEQDPLTGHLRGKVAIEYV